MLAASNSFPTAEEYAAIARLDNQDAYAATRAIRGLSFRVQGPTASGRKRLSCQDPQDPRQHGGLNCTLSEHRHGMGTEREVIHCCVVILPRAHLYYSEPLLTRYTDWPPRLLVRHIHELAFLDALRVQASV